MLVGSVAGQRYWSTLLPTDSQTITAATWTPDDQQVYLGTSQVGAAAPVHAVYIHTHASTHTYSNVQLASCCKACSYLYS